MIKEGSAVVWKFSCEAWKFPRRGFQGGGPPLAPHFVAKKTEFFCDKVIRRIVSVAREWGRNNVEIDKTTKKLYNINIGRGEIMGPVRLTYHKGYRHKDGTPYSPKHDDRNGFTKPKSAKGNFYMNFAGKNYGGETFLDGEENCYKALFRPHIKAQNAKNRKARHPERNLSLKQYYEKHPPEETLLYLGNKDNYADPRKLLEVFADYVKWLETLEDKEKGCGIELLNAALHTDEGGACHIQCRQIYYYTDKNGNLAISQNKALEGLGFGRPDPTRKTDRLNNAKQTFTAIGREKLFEIARSHGVELITEPLPQKDVGKTLDEYIAHDKAKLREKELEAREEDLERRERSLTIDEKDREDYYAFVEDKREREAAEAAERRCEQMLREKEEIQVRYADVLENAQEYVQKAPETTRDKETIPDTPKAQTPLKTPQRRYDVDALLQQWDDDHDDDPEMSL